MRRIVSTLAMLAFALAVPLGVAGSASAQDPITPGQCVAGGGRVLTLPAPHHPECIGGTYGGYPVIPPPPGPAGVATAAVPHIPPGYITSATCLSGGGIVVAGTNGIHYCEGGAYSGLPVIGPITQL